MSKVEEVVTDAHPQIKAYLSLEDILIPLMFGTGQKYWQKTKPTGEYTPPCCGQHEWALGDGVSPACCQHGPLQDGSREKEIEPDSPAHIALTDIVLDMNLIRNIPYYTQFRQTSALENFQSHVLVYAAKRFAYGFTRNFSKSAGRWTCVPQLMKDIFRRRFDDDKSQRGHVVLAEDDPRRISGTIRPSQPPSVAQLVASHLSRIGPSSTLL
ncbi:hypothetical protein BSL78_22711 [Apostichopus japonicus]|uniref:Uncharacterized protein n=1 Tax=Stichopus japonicus TaxID=307972 RepID=A0A2G8JXF8_STIJA|nr:hypothetical protein BSL78_22711 [Apostichopus japonicus]